MLVALLALSPFAASAQGSRSAADSAQGPRSPADSARPRARPDSMTTDTIKAWGELEKDGFLLAKTDRASLNLGLYLLARYINQLPSSETFTDHLGNVRPVQMRNDIMLHRVQLWLRGFFWDPKFRYEFLAWSVLAIQRTNLIGFLGYDFNKQISIYAGISGVPGTRSLLNIAPYFFGTDRFMADDFFRPGFTGGAWLSGEVLPGVRYKLMVGNSITQVGILAANLTRDLATGQTIWWMPTTGEFGPRGAGAYGDYENHKKVATRIGISHVHSREDRFNQLADPSPDNTQIRLSDSVLLFETGSLAPGVTVQKANYNLTSADFGVKYRGVHIQTDYFYRWLDGFDTDGPVPQSHIIDRGVLIQGSAMLVPRRLELLGATSQIKGQFNNPAEWVAGINIYPGVGRYPKINVMLLRELFTAAGGTFGYYSGGQHGTTLTISTDVFF
jgi:hypothetical protein